MSVPSSRGKLLALRAAAFGVAVAAVAPAAAVAAPPGPTTPQTPPTAAANTYEQVTRASGAAGISKLEALRTTLPSFVSDLGVSAAWSEVPTPLDFQQKGGRSTSFRNTLTNQTRAVAPTVGELISVDRTEQTGLWRRIEYPSATEIKVVWSVGRLDGSNRRDLDIQSEFGGAPVRLSGNGRFVITADQGGLRRLDLQTNAWTTIAPFAYLGKYAVSDDGQTIAAIDYDQEAQRVDAVLYRGTKKLYLGKGVNYSGPGTEPQISPDGSTAFTVTPGGDWPNPSTLTAHKVGTSASWTTTIPFEETWNARPLWISPSGDRIAWALSYQSPGEPTKPAQVWKVGAKQWTTFGGAFAGGLRSDDNSTKGSVVSRNGLFAAVAYNDNVALVSLSGLPLVGNLLGREGLSASSYIDTPGIDYCGFGFSSYFGAGFTRPAPWAPAPRSAKITFTSGSTIEDHTWTRPASAPGASSTGETDYFGVFLPLGTEHTRNLSLSVVDGHGRTVSEEFSKTLTCGQLPPETPES